MFSATVPITKLHMGMMQRWVFSPLQWPEGSPLPTISDCERTHRLNKIHFFLHGVYTTGMVVNYGLAFKGLELSQKMPAVAFCGGYVITFFSRLNLDGTRDELVSLIKAFLELDEAREMEMGPGSLQGGDLVTKALQLMGIAGGPGMGILVGGLVAVLPGFPPLLGFIIGWEFEWLGRTFLALFDSYMWGGLIVEGFFHVLGCCSVGMRCLQLKLRSVKQGLKQSQQRGRSFSATDEKAFRTYGQVQIVSGIFNQLYKDVLIPLTFIGIWVAFFSGLYGCVNLHGKVSMPGFGIFPLFFLAGLVAAFGVKLGANVAKESERCLEVARNHPNRKRNSLYKRKVRGMTMVKVRFGSTNWIDDLTPFNLLNHALNSCITVMLIN